MNPFCCNPNSYQTTIVLPQLFASQALKLNQMIFLKNTHILFLSPVSCPRQYLMVLKYKLFASEKIIHIFLLLGIELLTHKSRQPNLLPFAIQLNPYKILSLCSYHQNYKINYYKLQPTHYKLILLPEPRT